MSKIAPRQLFFLLAAVMPVGKFILMPDQLALYAGNDLLLPAAANIVLQAGVIFLVLLLARDGRDLFSLLRGTLGRIAATVLCLLYALFLLYAALMPVLEQKLFVQSVFYDTLPSLIAFAPFFLFSAYLCARPLSGFSRTWDILGPVFLLGFAGIVVLSFGSADFGALLPPGARGSEGFLKGSAYITGWFFDAAIVLSLLGKIEYRRGTAWKGALCYLAGGAATLLFLAIFYGIYADIAISELFALAKISQYFSGVSVLGRVDYLFIFALAFVAAFYCVLPLQAGIDIALQPFPKRKALAPALSVGLNLALFLFAYFTNFRFETVSGTITRTLFWIFPLFSLALPLLLPAVRRHPHEKMG